MKLPESIRRCYPIALASIVLLGLSLRVYQIGAKSFWYDETRSIWISRQPIADMLHHLITANNHPPLYFLLLHFWLRLTGGDSGVRLFSALFGILNIPVMYLLGKRIAGRSLGLLAALILAISPFHVLYAQEARMYTLLTLFVSLSLYFLVRLLSDPQAASVPVGRGLVGWWHSARAAVVQPRRGPHLGYAGSRAGGQLASAGANPGVKPSIGAALATDLSWLGLVLSTVAAVLTHNTAVFLPLGINCYVLGRYLVHRIAASRARAAAHDQGTGLAAGASSGGFIRNWLIAQLGVLLILCLWLPSFVTQSIRVDHSYWISPPTLRTVYNAWWALSSAGAPQIGPYNILFALLFPGLVILGLFYFRRQPHWPALLITIGLTLFVGELVVSLRRPIFLERTLIWASIPYYLLLAAGLAQLRRRAVALATLSLLVAINGFCLAGYYSNYQKEQWREATAYVCEQAGEQDLVILSAAYVETAFDYYRKDCAKQFDEQGMNATADNLASLPGLVAGRSKVWLVYSHDVEGDPQHLLADALEQEFHQAQNELFYGVQVLEYVR